MSQRSAGDDAGDRIRGGDGSCCDLATQDWLIVLEALAAWAGPPADAARGTTETPRQRRAWDLVDRVASEVGLAPDELLFQIDENWAGPSADE